jgi:hypothetical protein
MPWSYLFVSLRYPGHARFRALDAAGLSFFASALEARLPLIGSSISFCPAAATAGKSGYSMLLEGFPRKSTNHYCV